jgi:microcystin-dependent protein
MKIFSCILLCLSLSILYAQTPSAFKYQTSVRDNTGKLIANKLVAFKISLLQGSENGTLVYAERHSLATNDFGVASLNVGGGTTIQGVFANVNWGNGPYFLKTELDLNNGTNYMFMGTSQLLSVPYALYAAKSANAADDKDKDSTNEIQNLSLNGTQLSISKGNAIALGGVVDLDADPTNEVQTLSIIGDSLKISKGNGIRLPKDHDIDSINEIQSLFLKGDSLGLSKGNLIKLPKDNDTNSTNEIQSLSLNGDTLRLSQGNFIKLPKQYDGDTSMNNEIQTLSYQNNNLSISNGNSVAIPVVPVGTILAFAGVNIPSGYLICDGAAVSRSTYANLYGVIGNSWGAGNNSTTFNLPDLRGQFLRGVTGSSTSDPDASSRTAKYSGGNTGNNVGSYQVDEFKSHNHNLMGNITSGGGIPNQYVAKGQNDPNTFGLTTSNAGGNESRPKNAYVYYIIKF